MSLDLDLDDAQQAIHDAVSRFAEAQHPGDPLEEGALRDAWGGLAELGVLALATPDGDGGAAELVAALEALGRANFPGPLAATFAATQLLPAPDRTRVANGQALVALGAPPLLPFAPWADVFVELQDDAAWIARPDSAPAALATLGGEPFGRVELERVAPLEGVQRGHAIFDLSLAALLAGAGTWLIERAAEHARVRRQFGRAIGDFQAVAHPLADCITGLSAARWLARRAACAFDENPGEANAPAALARLSSTRAALEAVHVAHQVFGALGVTLEGGLFAVSRRVRQLASLPPDPRGARERALAPLALEEAPQP